MPFSAQRGRKEFERFLFEQRVAPGEEEDVEVAGAGEAFAGLPFVHAGADRRDGALRAHLMQRLVAAVHEAAEIAVEDLLALVRGEIEIVAEEDVDAVDAEAFEGMLDGAHHAVIAVVVDLSPRRRVEEFADARAFLGRGRRQQTADLRRQDIGVPRPAAQEMVDPGFGQAEPVERRRVVEARAGIPGCAERRLCDVFREGAVEIAEGRGAHPERGEREPRAVAGRQAAQRPRPALVHRFRLRDSSEAPLAGQPQRGKRAERAAGQGSRHPHTRYGKAELASPRTYRFTHRGSCVSSELKRASRLSALAGRGAAGGSKPAQQARARGRRRRRRDGAEGRLSRRRPLTPLRFAPLVRRRPNSLPASGERRIRARYALARRRSRLRSATGW